MLKLRDDDTVIAKQTSTNITYDIPADPKGQILKDQFQRALTAELGDDRAAFFKGYDDDSFYDRPFLGFAEKDSQVEVNWTYRDGTPLYTWKETSGDNSSWNSSPSPTIPPQYQKYLPTEMGP